MTEGLEIVNLQQRFVTQQGGEVEALGGVSMTVKRGEIVALLGPSGCGKTSLLNIVAGFERHIGGEVRFGGVPLGAPDGRRAVVFQQPALFDWLTVRDNVAYGLKRRRIAAPERARRVADMLELVALSEFAQAYPDELSGGMQQRVALARALVLAPEVLLLDEPFAALDALLRHQMQRLLLDVHGALRQTTLLVTHDVEEALAVAHRVVVLTARPGRVVDCIDLPGEPGVRDAQTEVMLAECHRRIRAALLAPSDAGNAANG